MVGALPYAIFDFLAELAAAGDFVRDEAFPLEEPVAGHHEPQLLRINLFLLFPTIGPLCLGYDSVIFNFVVAVRVLFLAFFAFFFLDV